MQPKLERQQSLDTSFAAMQEQQSMQQEFYTKPSSASLPCSPSVTPHHMEQNPFQGIAKNLRQQNPQPILGSPSAIPTPYQPHMHPGSHPTTPQPAAMRHPFHDKAPAETPVQTESADTAQQQQPAISTQGETYNI